MQNIAKFRIIGRVDMITEHEGDEGERPRQFQPPENGEWVTRTGTS